jgi:diguanylate cyclase (GGDEF)-like protein
VNDERYFQLYTLTSIVSLVFQILGTSLIALLAYIVSRAVRRRQVQYWSLGWMCLTIALLGVLVAPYVGPFVKVAWFAYYVGEYSAVLLMFAGCRNVVTDAPSGRWLPYAIALAAVVALTLASAPYPFYWIFVVHTAIVGLLWASCIIPLWPAIRSPDSGPGARLVAIGLALLALDYLHHVPAAFYFRAHGIAPGPYYYTIVSLIDGMLAFVLGFGTVVVIIDRVRRDLERTNWQLKIAHDRTQDALHTDELTGAFSRYAFTETFGGASPVERGCIVVADLDGLKEVNDTLGHAVGDVAIKAVADGLRALVRHEDRVYRFGGDEFVVVLAFMPLALARQRFAALDAAINGCVPSGSRIGAVSVSWGVAEFGPHTKMDEALAVADAAMYEQKSSRKGLARRS